MEEINVFEKRFGKNEDKFNRFGELTWKGKTRSQLSDENREYYLFFNKVMNELDGISNRSSTPKYNTKDQEEWVEWCMENFRFKRGLLITIHLPSYLTFGRFSETSQRINQKNPTDYFFQIEQLLTRFYRRLERRVYKGGKQRLEKFSVIEGCYNKFKRNHIHTIVEVPEHMSVRDFCILIHKSQGSWIKSEGYTNWLVNGNNLESIKLQNKNEVPNTLNKRSLKKFFEMGNIDIRKLDTFGRQRLYTYLTKECKGDRYTVSSKNTYERSLRYLEREKRVKQERKKWIPNSRTPKYPTLFPLERFMKDDFTDGEGKKESRLNNLVNCKSSLVSRSEKSFMNQ